MPAGGCGLQPCGVLGSTVLCLLQRGLGTGQCLSPPFPVSILRRVRLHPIPAALRSTPGPNPSLPHASLRTHPFPQSSQLLDEVTTCWAMISFKKCASLQREVSISVPLYYGSIYDPKPMDAYYAAQRA